MNRRDEITYALPFLIAYLGITTVMALSLLGLASLFPAMVLWAIFVWSSVMNFVCVYEEWKWYRSRRIRNILRNF